MLSTGLSILPISIFLLWTILVIVVEESINRAKERATMERIPNIHFLRNISDTGGYEIPRHRFSYKTQDGGGRSINVNNNY